MAIEEIKKPVYDLSLLRQDKEFVIKKFLLTEESFEELMKLPIKSFEEYSNSFKMVNRIKKLVNTLREKEFYSK
jgi:hypothetical protein